MSDLPARFQVVLDPEDAGDHSAFLHGLADLHAGRLVCDLAPGTRHRITVANQLLRALGKRHDLTGTTSRAGEAWDRLYSWVVGEEVRDIIVARAHMLPRSGWESLLVLAATADAALWLLVQGMPLTRGQKETIRDWSIPTHDWHAFEARWRSARTSARPGSEPEPTFPAVPSDEFPTVVAACRRLLAPGALTRVLGEFAAARDATSRWLDEPKPTNVDTPEEHLARVIADLVRPCTSLDRMLVRVRAAQVAAFERGYLVSLNRDALAGAYFATPLAELSEPVAAELRAYSQTRYAAVATAALASRHSPTALAELRLCDIAADGQSVSVLGRSFPVPEHAAGILRAHRLFRCSQRARGDDPLFVSEDRSHGGWRGRGLGASTAHGIQQQLRRVALETGVPVVAPGKPAETEPTRWLRRRGLMIRRL